ncbi:MAG: MarR family winged helix-turn-helix transcriptional regulator [Gemmatimonadaceae bacterium]
MFALLHAAHALEDKIEASLASVGLSGPKYSVLTALVAAGEPVALGELAGRLSCVKSNVTQMVDRLEADGLVRRIADPEDRRSVKAEVTSVGRERQTAGAAVIDTLEAQFSQAVRAEDRSAVSRLLRSIHSV